MAFKHRIRRFIQWVKGDPDEIGDPEPFTPGGCCLGLVILVSAILVLLYFVYTR
jgi:hypothetical protein